MTFTFEVTVKIDPIDPSRGCHDRQSMRMAALEAVISALATGEYEGFNHELEETTTIEVLRVREGEYKPEDEDHT